MSRTDTQIRMKRKRGDNGDLVRLKGVLDERFDRAGFVRLLAGEDKPFVVDFDRVPYITSFGVREWLAALRDLDGRRPYFIRCRPAVANQFNMIADFAGGGRLVSFYCPYLCERCETAFEVLFDVRFWDRAPAEFADRPQPCPKCKRGAEFDDLPDAYFAFVSSAPPAAIPPGVVALIDGKPDDDKTGRRRGLTVAKEVEGTLTAVWLSGELRSASRLSRAATGLEGLVVVILEGVTEASDAGLDALTAVLMQPAEHWLARVPTSLLTGALLAELEVGSTRVASLFHPARCKACGFEGNVVLDRDGRERLAKTERVPCPRCQASAEADKLPLEAKRVKLSEPPAAVEEYLDAHPDLAQGPRSPELESTDPTRRSRTTSQGPLAKYRIEQRLGYGGMAEVFLGRQLGLEGFEKAVVIKRLLPHLAKNEDFVSLFVDEARMAARITHSNVVQIFDLERAEGTFYIVMELVRGCDLKTVFLLCRRLDQQVPVPIALSMLADTCAGLAAAHECTDMDGKPYPIIHRDVSPHNILMSLEGEVKVADFGIAKAVDNQHKTNPGDLKGKTPYLAPELIEGNPADQRVDLFAAGLVLFAALTLEHPFKRANDTSTLLAIMGEEPPKIASARPEVPAAVDRVVQRALAKDPDARYPSARAMLKDLDALLKKIGRPSQAERAEWLRGLLSAAKDSGFVEPEEIDELGSMTTTTPANLVRGRAVHEGKE